MDNYDIKAMNRFKQKIEIIDEHWIWKGHIHKSGRGRFSYKNRAVEAHRFSALMWVNNVDPLNKNVVCHNRNCLEPSCVNPKHLYWGTPDSNSKDAIAKGELIGRPSLADRFYCSRGHNLSLTKGRTSKNERWPKCLECAWLHRTAVALRKNPEKRIFRKVLDRLADSGYSRDSFENEFLNKDSSI